MKKIAVGILGATGMVGQKFVELLATHPWFEITALAASDRSINKKYGQAMSWGMPTPLPEKFAEMPVLPCFPNLPCRIVFSGLDSSVAGEIEHNFASAGYIVISNSKNHRMDYNVPLLIPEVNSDHLELMASQPYEKGGIVTNPNCSVIGITLALKPLLDNWGIESVNVVTLQALSGAGYPGVPSMDILDNVIPFISGEEAKIETEPLKILGNYQQNGIINYPMRLSAHCTRVAVADGHLACISVKFKEKAARGQIVEAWKNFSSDPQFLKLPTAPKHPILYLDDERHPQPKLHRHLADGMAVSVGRLRECPLFNWKFVVLSHNTVRGAAGCAILNAELMVKKGYLGNVSG
ncbi:MAG: aspartate-semialdehyde dehydrogenase [Parachlamydiaceae bacterium]|nr:aspartate-semialdehyde dehydrogenase [Parachlamydiaceae bacterium]